VEQPSTLHLPPSTLHLPPYVVIPARVSTVRERHLLQSRALSSISRGDRGFETARVYSQTPPTFRQHPGNAMRSAFNLAASFALAAAVLSGCGSSKNTVDVRLADMQIGAASSSIRGAEALGARDYAPVELRQAQQKLEAAQQALKAGDNARALRLAEQAKVDADLAEITALSEKSQAAVEQIRQSVETLREEMSRRNNR